MIEVGGKMVKEQNLKRLILDYALITFGSFVCAVGIIFFLEPHTIAPGGATGLAIVLRRLTGLPVDIGNLAINIPLFLGAMLLLGKGASLRTAYSTVMLSVFVRVVYFALGAGFTPGNDVLLGAIFGGLCLGVGSGLVFRAGGTTGGSSLAAAILNRFVPQISVQKLMVMIDLVIVASTGIIERQLSTPLYSFVALFIILKSADFIVEGLNFAKQFIIISERYKEISDAILFKLGRGATLLRAQGMCSWDERPVIMCAVNPSEVYALKKIIQELDPKAFVVVSTVHEVLGEGFSLERHEKD